MSFAIAGLPGRRFEEQPEIFGCKGCVFKHHSPNNNTLTEKERITGCAQVDHCGYASVIIKEVGFDPSRT